MMMVILAMSILPDSRGITRHPPYDKLDSLMAAVIAGYDNYWSNRNNYGSGIDPFIQVNLGRQYGHSTLALLLLYATYDSGGQLLLPNPLFVPPARGRLDGMLFIPDEIRSRMKKHIVSNKLVGNGYKYPTIIVDFASHSRFANTDIFRGIDSLVIKLG